MEITKPTQAPTVKDSEDNCSQCGLQISSQRQIEHPGCCFCQECADDLSGSEHSK